MVPDTFDWSSSSSQPCRSSGRSIFCILRARTDKPEDTMARRREHRHATRLQIMRPGSVPRRAIRDRGPRLRIYRDDTGTSHRLQSPRNPFPHCQCLRIARSAAKPSLLKSPLTDLLDIEAKTIGILVIKVGIAF